jgi:hypothetical protein
MYKSHLIAILYVVLLISCSSPTIVNQKTIGGDEREELESSCLTKDGGFISGGFSFSQKSGEKTTYNHGIFYCDFWIIKFNKKGEIQWQKSLGGTNLDYLRSIAITDDGGYIIAGESASDSSGDKSENSRGSADFWIVKLDSIGNIQWDKTYGGSGTELCGAVKQTADGGYIIVGGSNSNISGDKTDSCRGDYDLWVLKLNREGKKEWDKTIGGNQNDRCLDFEFTNDEGIILCANSSSEKSGEKSETNRGLVDFWIVKLDKTGKIEWDKTIGGKEDDWCYTVKKTTDGNYILAGSSRSNKGNEKSENSKGGWDCWLVKIDSSGNKIWDKTIGGSDDEIEFFGLNITRDGGYIIGGMSRSNISGDKTDSCRGNFDFWVVKLDKGGNVNWDKTIGGNDYDELRSIEEIEKDHFLITGFTKSDKSGDKTDSSRGMEDFWIVYLND